MLLMGFGLFNGAVCATDLKVMTFNVRYPSPDDGVNIWPQRRHIFVETVRHFAPDIMGTQEIFAGQAQDIVISLPQYRWFGVDRFGGHSNEHMGIFYDARHIVLSEHGVFWLSEQPNVSGSLGWGATLPRYVNWGVFEVKNTSPSQQKRRFLFLDTHLANRDVEDAVARRHSVQLILEKLPHLSQGLPVVLVGDFNSAPEDEAHQMMRRSLMDVWEHTLNKAGPSGTFHDFTGKPQAMLDYILVRGFTPQSVRVDTRHEGGHYPSDHFPVEAILRFSE